MTSTELVSCVMVTQASRTQLGALAMGDFFAQTWPQRELLVLHDGDDAAHEAWSQLAAITSGAVVRVLQAPPGLTLGALRNIATQAAHGSIICQWDDDDRYHPQRIELQMQALSSQSADFCFLRDQLHWFVRDSELMWDDWNSEAFPLNFVQGTLLGKRAYLPVYPELARGEDTGVTLDILRAGRRIARLADAGWCYAYVYHGSNVWDANHHRAISRGKRRGPARLQNVSASLKQRLAEYTPPFAHNVT